MSHSKAPWTYDEDTGRVYSADDKLLLDATQLDESVDDDESAANARLMAAAPTLLEELNYCADGLRHINTPWAKERLIFVHKAINVALGGQP